MGENFDKKHKIQELTDMLNDRKPNESVEEVLVTYCQRHGISLDDCRNYYNQLAKEGKIKEK